MQLSPEFAIPVRMCCIDFAWLYRMIGYSNQKKIFMVRVVDGAERTMEVIVEKDVVLLRLNEIAFK